MQHVDVQHRPRTAPNVTAQCRVSVIVTLLAIAIKIYARTLNTRKTYIPFIF